MLVKCVKMAAICLLLLLFTTGCEEKSNRQRVEDVQDLAGNVSSIYKDLTADFADNKGIIAEDPSKPSGAVDKVVSGAVHRLNSWNSYYEYALSYLISGSFPEDPSLPSESSAGSELSGDEDKESGNILPSFDIQFSEEAEQDPETLDEPKRVTLNYVVDGDTLDVNLDGVATRIRLIGINTPESVAHEDYLEATGKENTQEGKDASAFVKELLSGTEELWLTFDKERQDKYGRTLAYVWLTESTLDTENMLQVKILQAGHAEVMTIAPNTKYQEVFERYRDDLK